MPTATLPTLSEDQIDDILYLARLGETQDLIAGVEALAKTLSTTVSTILTAAVDPANGNGLLHMASANGHTETLTTLLTLPSPSQSLNLNLQNASGNTPLHWAALNGHLSTVQALVKAGADVTVVNETGHDAIYAAEVNEKGEVVEWLLREGKGVVGGDGLEGVIEGRGEEEGEGEVEGNEGNGKGEGEGGNREGDVVEETQRGDVEQDTPIKDEGLKSNMVIQETPSAP